jgi:3-oxoacyl-[acyl-carrier protein] reductase
VTAAARNAEAIEAWRGGLAAELAARLTALPLDLADLASVDRVADAVLAAGGVDILINNCGGPAPGGVVGTSAEAWTKAFQSMAASVFHLTDRMIRPMIEQRWGRIVTIGSSGIVQPIPNLAISNAIRGSVAGWSKSLANEVAGQGITVNMVLPGRIETDRLVSLDQNRATKQGLSLDEVRRQSLAEIPAGRYGTPEEFAAVTVFLASAPAAYVTGGMLRIDGGLIRNV